MKILKYFIASIFVFSSGSVTAESMIEESFSWSDRLKYSLGLKFRSPEDDAAAHNSGRKSLIEAQAEYQKRVKALEPFFKGEIGLWKNLDASSQTPIHQLNNFEPVDFHDGLGNILDPKEVDIDNNLARRALVLMHYSRPNPTQPDSSFEIETRYNEAKLKIRLDLEELEQKAVDEHVDRFRKKLESLIQSGMITSPVIIDDMIKNFAKSPTGKFQVERGWNFKLIMACVEQLPKLGRSHSHILAFLAYIGIDVKGKWYKVTDWDYDSRVNSRDKLRTREVKIEMTKDVLFRVYESLLVGFLKARVSPTSFPTLNEYRKITDGQFLMTERTLPLLYPYRNELPANEFLKIMAFKDEFEDKNATLKSIGKAIRNWRWAEHDIPRNAINLTAKSNGPFPFGRDPILNLTYLQIMSNNDAIPKQDTLKAIMKNIFDSNDNLKADSETILKYVKVRVSDLDLVNQIESDLNSTDLERKKSAHQVIRDFILADTKSLSKAGAGLFKSFPALSHQPKGWGPFNWLKKRDGTARLEIQANAGSLKNQCRNFFPGE